MRIVIVGGVAAGMSCAARARRLDENAEIIILEQGPYVSYAGCGLPYHVGGEITSPASLLVQTPASLLASLNLDVRTHHRVTALDPAAKTVTVESPAGTEQLSYDSLVLAPGAAAVTPPIPGIESRRVTTLRTVDEAVALRKRVVGDARRAVVLGGGFIGLEAAEQLAGAGLRTTVVEMASHVLPPLEREIAGVVTAELRSLGVDVRAGVAATAIKPAADADTVVLADGSEVPADVIVLSVGVRPNTAVFEAAGVACERGAILTDEHGRTNLPDVYAAGDAVASVDAITGVRRPVALAGPANRAGRLIADAILRPDRARAIPTALGTAIVRVGRMTAGMTGANRASLEAAGIPHHTIHVHPWHHVSWYPGATPISITANIGADGRLLGAQAVGEHGVDKRVDVLATAIRNRMLVPDLVDLDLAYAPVCGAAKDPVNFVGMVGANLLDGMLRLTYPWDQLGDGLAEDPSRLLLDVRSPEEFATGHVPGALNVPHTALRERLAEVLAAAAGRPIVTICGIGLRSYLAQRVLAAAGADASTLSGGVSTLAAYQYQ